MKYHIDFTGLNLTPNQIDVMVSDFYDLLFNSDGMNSCAQLIYHFDDLEEGIRRGKIALEEIPREAVAGTINDIIREKDGLTVDFLISGMDQFGLRARFMNKDLVISPIILRDPNDEYQLHALTMAERKLYH